MLGKLAAYGRWIGQLPFRERQTTHPVDIVSSHGGGIVHMKVGELGA